MIEEPILLDPMIAAFSPPLTSAGELLKGSTGDRSRMREHTDAFATLKQQIKQHGLLEKQLPFYTFMILSALGLLGGSIAILALVHIWWVQVLNAVVLAFLSTQFGFLGHDAGHRQIAKSTRINDVIGLFLGNFLVGMSFSWWLDKHNRHHSNPNQLDHDPDINIPILAFSAEDGIQRTGFQRYMVRHQAFFFFPILMLVAIDLQVNSIKYVLAGKAKYQAAEVLLLVAHWACYLGAIFLLLPAWQGLIFIAVHQMLFGLYLGTTFAPNHKGMPIIASDSKMNFLQQQVLTARNVHANIFNDYWYGGLNYQIEHHLFPSLPRNKLKQAQRIIRQFCEEHEIPYYETGAIQSFREILAHLAEVSSVVTTEAQANRASA